MKVYSSITQRTPEWFDVRMGKVTGTSLQKIVGTPAAKKQAIYELIAGRMSLPDYTEENPMVRGARLEEEARKAYEDQTGYKVEEVGFCHREDNKFVGFSPDGLIKIEDKYRGHLEMKCLGGGNHVQALIENKIPEEHMPQVIQGMIVNDDCEWVDFWMYDPRNAHYPTILFRVDRQDVAEDIVDYKHAEEKAIEEVNNYLKTLIK